MDCAIRAVFFDSGNTLMRPVGGRWFPGVRFFDLCRELDEEVPDDEDLARACGLGYAYLDAHHFDVSDGETERLQFCEYYRVIFRALGRAVPDELIQRLAHSAVADLNFEPYPTARPLLDELAARGIPMALLTDGWPSTRTKFAALDFRHYFGAFVISSEVKCTKPDLGMFRPALDALSVSPENVLFVDDAPDLVVGAQAHGFRTVLVDHAGRYPGQANRVTCLKEILAFIG